MSTFLMPQQQEQQQQNFYICEINFAYLVNFLFFRCFCCYFYIFTGIWQKTEFLFAAYKFLWPIRCDCCCWKVARKSERTLIERTWLKWSGVAQLRGLWG